MSENKKVKHYMTDDALALVSINWMFALNIKGFIAIFVFFVSLSSIIKKKIGILVQYKM